MKKRLIGTVLCAAVVVGALSGCGSKDTANDNEKKTIRITYSAGELDGESKDLNVIFADFYKDHPNCEVVLEEGGSALMAKIAANDAPDIIRTNSILDLPTYVNKNIIMPLDDMLKKSDLYDEKDIFPVCIDCFKYDGKDFGKGKIYGLPKDWGPSSMWVNKSMLDAKGLRVPTYDAPITFDELADYAKKLTVKEGNKVKVFGYSNIEAPNVTGETMLNLIGKSMYSDDFSKINLKDEDVRKAVKIENEARKALKRLYEVMQHDPAPISGHDLFKVLYGSTFKLNRSEIAGEVNALVDKIEAEYASGKMLEKKPRILITGCPIGGATEKVIRAVEDNGGVVVTYENCTGAKSIDRLVDENAEDIYQAIAERYLAIGCSVMTPNPNRFDLMGRLIDEYQVDGVLEMTLQACHTYNVETRAIRKFVNEEKGIPYINVETDYSQADVGQLNTRIAAFIEML